MRMYDIIEKKRDSGVLTEEEINYFIKGITNGDIPEYQTSALLMAIFLNKMTEEETFYLTKAMAESGDKMDFTGVEGFKTDKHSTGGVGDKTTLIVAPIVAAAGGKVCKMSGRGLGFTGGTIDKLNSIPGFHTDISIDEFKNTVNKCGMSVVGQSKNLVPADKILYALRDVTATVDNISLIASSIMSKKLALNTDGIVLDVKVGSGAFMKNIDDARRLSRLMVKLGNMGGIKTVAVITDMNQPLGKAVGNSLEVIEAIECLKGNVKGDLREAAVSLSSEMIYISGITKNRKDAVLKAEEMIDSGKALEVFNEFVTMQGGDGRIVDDYSLFETALYKENILSEEEGYIRGMNTGEIGRASVILGGGREKKEDDIDYSVGLIFNKKLNDYVKKNDIMVSVCGNDRQKIKAAKEKILSAITIAREPDRNIKGVYETVE